MLIIFFLNSWCWALLTFSYFSLTFEWRPSRFDMISATFDISSDARISAQVAHLTSGLAKVVMDAAASGQLKNVEAGPVGPHHGGPWLSLRCTPRNAGESWVIWLGNHFRSLGWMGICSNLLSSLKLSFFQVSMIGHALNEARMKGGAQSLRISYLRPISLTLLRFHALLFQVIQPFLTLAQFMKGAVSAESISAVPLQKFLQLSSSSHIHSCWESIVLSGRFHGFKRPESGIKNSAILWLHSENTWGQNSVQRQRRSLSLCSHAVSTRE